MSTNETSAIRDLIKVLNDGVEFYTDAKIELKGSGYEPALQDMIDVRQGALARLQQFVYASDGEVETGHTFVGTARKAYADVLAKIKSNKSQTYIVQLEELEDRTLEFIKKALDEATAVDTTAALNFIYATLQQCHNRMRSLKRNVA
ncbi:MAG TPA: PA2169 family four-helix-bundle protein [Cellvibrio sp.]|nr:PA2169 family four-helix-bundle protein [Cellvibrio sp.]